MAELTTKGAEFIGDVRDEGWGITARLKVPGAGEMTLYQPNCDRPRRRVSSQPRRRAVAFAGTGTSASGRWSRGRAEMHAAGAG
jgi:hypothetical protein